MNAPRWLAVAALLTLGHAWAEDGSGFRVEIRDGGTPSGEILLPLDPTPRLQIGHGGNIHFGLMVNNVRITCSPQGSVWPSALVDGRVLNPANVGVAMQVDGLQAGKGGKARTGYQCKWTIDNLEFSQIVEVIPSKPAQQTLGARRQLDTCRMSYVVTNRGKPPRDVAMRCNLDILVNQNDGALYASPVTAPGKILNGVTLEGKALPPYLQVLERADLTNPGVVATMTFKFGSRIEGPSKV